MATVVCGTHHTHTHACVRASQGAGSGSSSSAVVVAVNSSNVRGLCAFCTVDAEGISAVRGGGASYTITVGDAETSLLPPLVITAQ